MAFGDAQNDVTQQIFSPWLPTPPSPVFPGSSRPHLALADPLAERSSSHTLAQALGEANPLVELVRVRSSLAASTMPFEVLWLHPGTTAGATHRRCYELVSGVLALLSETQAVIVSWRHPPLLDGVPSALASAWSHLAAPSP